MPELYATGEYHTDHDNDLEGMILYKNCIKIINKNYSEDDLNYD